MQRKSREHGGRPIVPIFGCRKRQRQAVYADPLDLRSNDDDDVIFFTNSIPYPEQEITAKSKGKFIYNPSDRRTENHLINNNSKNEFHFPAKKNQMTEREKFSYQPQHNKLPLLPPPSRNRNNTLQKFSSNRNSCWNFKTPEHIQTNITTGKINKPIPATNDKKCVLKKRTTMVTRVITSSIQGIELWRDLSDKALLMFEIFGVLDSTIPYHAADAEKMFTLKNNTANIRCKFWEIDRRLPKIGRGTRIRCVGKLNDSYFHCVSLRVANTTELRILPTLLQKSDHVLHDEILTDREM
ncbi:spermatogenesis-associated protein 22-like [Hydractinia symbiolongicarpus]|uniref:spermatogenesis-associated protein 22-like n=1 Tax=Hydractinia symbiolongicarpus TaxID=13093 RepID=UPI00254EF676|nr:spermatogenesis-associated protein 22-like [Hydractinia symbiolongicarpus]